MNKHLMGRTFDELVVGDNERTRGRTLTESDVVQWCAITGDWHYLHSDAVATESTFFGQRVVPGLMVLSLSTGLATPADATTIMANYGMDRVRYIQPTWIDDTICVNLSVKEKRERNQSSGVVTYKWDILGRDGELACTADLKILTARSRAPYPGHQA